MPSLSFSLNNFSGRSQDSSLPFVPSNEILATAGQEQDARGCLYRGAFAHSRSCSGDTHPRRAGARQFGPNWLHWHVGGDQLAPSKPTLCTPCPVSISTGWLVGWPAFPAPWGTQPSCLATEHRGSSGPTAGDTREPRLPKGRVRRLLWDASVAFLVSQCNANYARDDSSLQPRRAGSMVNMECQEEVSGREWNRRLPPSQTPHPSWLFPFVLTR